MATLNRKALEEFPQESKLDAGTYAFEVASFAAKTSDKTGREYYSVGAKVVDGPEQRNGTNPVGRMVFFNLMAVLDGDKPSTVQMFNSRLNGFFNAFGDNLPEEFDPSDEDFVEMIKGQVFGMKFGWKANKESGDDELNIIKFSSVGIDE